MSKKDVEAWASILRERYGISWPVDEEEGQ